MGAPKGNKYALGNNGGRPRIYATVEELNNAIIEYFEDDSEKHTITGLALHLGFESRQSMFDYAETEEFSYVIKRAKLAIENSYEQSGTAFDIFALKNMGWKDKTEREITTPQGITVNYNLQPGNAPLMDADD